jgi:hypothetical protein
MTDSMTWSTNSGSCANIPKKGSLAASASPNWPMISWINSSRVRWRILSYTPGPLKRLFVELKLGRFHRLQNY